MPRPKLERPRKRSNVVKNYKTNVVPTLQPPPTPTNPLSTASSSQDNHLNPNPRPKNVTFESSDPSSFKWINQLKSGIIQKIISAFMVAVVCSTVIRFTLLLDMDKQILKHKPGICKTFHTNMGKTNSNYASGYMEYVEQVETLFITEASTLTESNRSSSHFLHPGAVYAMHIPPSVDKNEKSNDDLQTSTPIKLAIEHDSGNHHFDREKFSPLGLSASVNNHIVTLYIVNSHNSKAGGKTIEVFKYLSKQQKLVHLKTISDGNFQSLKDVQIVPGGGDRFFAVNGYYFDNEYLQKIETAIHYKSGNLVFYNGKSSTIVDRNFGLPSAVALDAERGFIYVAAFTAETIKAYQLNKDYSVQPMNEIALLSSPNKIHVDKKSGDLWISAQPVFHKYLKHEFWDNSTKIPSHVLRIRFQGTRSSWVITEPFANDGSSFSGITGISIIGEKLAMGSRNGKCIICNMNNYNLA